MNTGFHFLAMLTGQTRIFIRRPTTQLRNSIYYNMVTQSEATTHYELCSPNCIHFMKPSSLRAFAVLRCRICFRFSSLLLSSSLDDADASTSSYAPASEFAVDVRIGSVLPCAGNGGTKA